MVEKQFTNVVGAIRSTMPVVADRLLETAEQRKSWFAALQDCDIVDVKTVLFRLSQGGIEKPKLWDDYLPTIRQHAKQLEVDRQVKQRQQQEPQDEDFRLCQLCHGTGIVVRRDAKKRKMGYACRCSRGRKWTAEREVRSSSAWYGKTLAIDPG